MQKYTPQFGSLSIANDSYTLSHQPVAPQQTHCDNYLG
jgi:hypothetical protein